MSLQLSSSRRKLLMILGVFILPVVLAKLALEQQWFEYGVTNQGKLAETHMTLTELGLSHEKFKEQWLLMYRIPTDCDQSCRQAMLAVNNTYTLLGKELPRVTPVALSERALNDVEQSQLKHFKWLQLALPDLARDKIGQAQLLVVDPMGNVVMSHDTPLAQEKLSEFSKAILADMKKLLKYSRIG